MPLSLLLTQQLTLLTEGVKKLAGWEGLTDTFALVARRLRGAFLVGWFGTAVPVQGLDVVVTVTNLDELYDRYLQVTSGNRADRSGGPNLVEPLLGAGGVLAGALAAPLNGMVVSMVAGSVLRGALVKLFAGLGWITAGALPAAVLLLAGPLVALALLPQAFGGQAGDAVELLGALAAMALPLRSLWAQLSGREPARNPLLRQLMTLGDRLTALLAQVLATVAVAVTRIAPQLYPAMAAARATYGALMPIVEAIGLVVRNMLDGMRLLVDGPSSLASVQAVVIRAVRRLAVRLRELVLASLAEVVTIVTARVPVVLRAVVAYVRDASRFVQAAIVDTPFVRVLQSFAGLARALQKWADRPAPPKPATPKTPTSAWITSFPALPATADTFGRIITTRPSAPRLPLPAGSPLIGPDLVAPLARIRRARGLGADTDPFALDDAQSAAFDRFRRPPSVLGGLAADLQRRSAASAERGAAFALADLYAGMRPLVDRALAPLAPGAATSLLPGIEGMLDQLDVRLRGRRADFPVRELPEPQEVRPVIGRLVVRAAPEQAADGDDAEREYRAFVATFRRRLDARSYTVAATRAGAP